MLAFVFTDFVFIHFAVCQPVYSLVLSVPCLRMLCFSFQLSPLSYFLCCIVPLCHFSASLCFCYPSFCLLYHFLIQYLLTCLPVFSNYVDFSFFIFVNIYTYYDMVGCTTCADALLDLVVCVPFSDLYLFKIGIGMRSSLIIVCINSVFPFISFSIFSWPGANWVFFPMFFHAMCRK